MKTVRVKEVMVPLKDYATVSENVNLYEAVLALEKAQATFDQSHYTHRAILVYNDKNQIVGKISQLDILKALEPKYNQIVDLKGLSRFGYNLDYIESISKLGLWDKPLRDLCKSASNLIVKNFMYTPKEGEYIKEDADLDEAIHQLIIGQHQSLLVTRNGEIVGVLRLTDVFKMVCENIKECPVQ
jgi:CBS domain-containing protein